MLNRMQSVAYATLFAALTLAVAAPAAAQTAPAAPQATPALRDPDVIFVPTPPEVVEAMLKLAGVTSKDVVYDLGCGDGMIVTAAARDYGATAVGIDINPVRVKEANDRVAKAGVQGKVKILNDDLFTTNISQASVVTLYLLQSLNEKLIPKLNKELKPGTRIVSQTFTMGDRYPPEKTVTAGYTSVYLWTVPMKEKK
jgi:cyclopropane fatty-acyl-phospholipid synthase-like methyltransferase